MTTLYQTFSQLSDEQRIDARERAAKLTLKAVGDKPRRESFLNSSVSKYPSWFTRFVAGLMAVVFVAAGMPSLFRLYSAGRDYFMLGINDSLQASIVGFSTFLLAESLVVLSTIAMRVYFTGRAQWFFGIPIFMGLSMALVGNHTVVQPHDPFSWLETIVPVFTVLFVAIIGERLVLESLETRHANEKAYQEALVSWQTAAHAPETHPRFASILANALRDALKVVNSEGSGATRRKELMSALSVEHWKALVYRELQADNWYATPLESVPELPALPEQAPAPRRSRKSEQQPEAEQPIVEAVIVDEPRPFGQAAPGWESDAPELNRAKSDALANMPMIEPLIAPVSSANGNGKH